MTNVECSNVLDVMEAYGGSFIRQLARLYAVADDINRQRLERAFPEYFAKYREIAERRAS